MTLLPPPFALYERLEPHTIDEWIAMEDEEVEWLVQDVMPKRGRIILHGASQSFKSFAAAQLCADLAAGVSPWGAFPPATSPVGTLLLQGEGGKPAWRKRMVALRQHYDSPALPFYSSHSLQDKLTDPPVYRVVCEYIETIEPELVVVDTRAKWLEGDENESTDVIRWTDILDRIADAYRTAVALVHHDGKPRRQYDLSGNLASETTDIRGSSHFLSWADVAIHMQAKGSGRNKVATMCFEKTKDSATPDEVRFQLLDGRLVLAEKADKLTHAVLRALEEGVMTQPDLVLKTQAETGLSQSHIYRLLADLEKSGQITVYREGKTHTVGLGE